MRHGIALYRLNQFGDALIPRLFRQLTEFERFLVLLFLRRYVSTARGELAMHR